MVRALSRGRFDRSPALDTDYDYDRDRDRGHSTTMDTMRSMKKQSYTPRGTSAPRGGDNIYSTPPRSPLDAAARSTSRSRFGSRDSRDRAEDIRGRAATTDYGGGEYEDHRNPLSEGRAHANHSSSFSRSASTMRERFDSNNASTMRERFDSNNNDEDSVVHSVGGSSHARDVLTKMRSGRSGMDRLPDRGMYSEPPSKPPRSLGGRNISSHTSHISVPSPRRRLDLHGSPHTPAHTVHTQHTDYTDYSDDMHYGVGIAQRENHNINTNSPSNDPTVVPASRYEVLGMKEELKKKDDQNTSLRREMDELQIKCEENMNAVRTKLVSTFKEDMQEMKTEWEEAFQRLKDEGDSTQRAMEMELNEVTRSKGDLEGEMNELKAEYRTQMEDEKNKSKERMEELKKSKEEDLERLRGMYEEHLDSTKKSASDVEGELKEEIHVLLEENEKVKLCFENIENELNQYKNDLQELNDNYQKALGDNVRWEKETAAVKEELEDVLDENDKRTRRNKALEGELDNTKDELQQMSSQYQRSQAEKSRFEKEYDAASKERDEVTGEYQDLMKKLDAIQEERTLESRYTEALVKQRDNMNAIIENSATEIDELKDMNRELTGVHREYANLAKEFRLVNGDADTLREELHRGEEYASLGKLDRLKEELKRGEGYASLGKLDRLKEELRRGEEYASLGRIDLLKEELMRNEDYAAVAKEFHLPVGDANALREELLRSEETAGVCKEFRTLVKDPEALREELAKAEKMKERLETLGRERERYNATVKALKVDLKSLHGGSIGTETSLQEHMRHLNEKWDSNESRLKQIEKLKSELDESIQLLEENAKDRERMMKEHGNHVQTIERELSETQTALVKMEREKLAMDDKLSDYELLDSKKKRITEELEVKCEKLADRLAYVEDERQERDGQCKSLDSDKRSLQAELEKVRSKKAELEDSLEKMDDVKMGLKKKLESAYYDLEERQRDLNSLRQDHEGEMQTFENELSKLSKQKDVILEQEEEINNLKDMLNRTRREQTKDMEDAQSEVAESFKVQLRLMEEKHADQDRRNHEYLAQKHKGEIEELRASNKRLEMAMKEQKEGLDQKSMVEIKRRGEFAKQKQELEILRSKERHLETHVNQLEEHISKVVADYETKLQSSAATICSTTNEEKGLKRQVRELEKKLEVSSAAMKQIGKSSLLMEKENDRLKHDKNELKLKLKKLVDCAEKFGPK